MNDSLKSTKQNPDDPTTIVSVGDVTFGDSQIPVIAGPCAVESYEQLETVAKNLKKLGVQGLRAGAFKPRTSPYSFQGMGVEGLKHLAEIKKEYNLQVFSEVMSVEHIEQALEYVDCFQVGSRNMQNFELLKKLGETNTPVLLKRGFAATLKEFIYSAEYILAGGNNAVILCERGIRSFDPETRNVLDLGGVAALKEMTNLPVIVDPSHATGKQSLVIPAARAGVAVGGDGIIVEAHPVPNESISDADQALSMDMLADLVNQLEPVAKAVDRVMSTEVVKNAHPKPKAGEPAQSVLASQLRMKETEQRNIAKRA